MVGETRRVWLLQCQLSGDAFFTFVFAAASVGLKICLTRHTSPVHNTCKGIMLAWVLVKASVWVSRGGRVQSQREAFLHLGCC